VEVAEEVREVLGVDGGIQGGLGRHHVATVEDGGGDAGVGSGGSAGEVGLFEDAEKRWAVEWAGFAIVVALSAVGLEDLVATGLLRRELAERRGWGCGVAA
jgi:hypothetical protein